MLIETAVAMEHSGSTRDCYLGEISAINVSTGFCRTDQNVRT